MTNNYEFLRYIYGIFINLNNPGKLIFLFAFSVFMWLFSIVFQEIYYKFVLFQVIDFFSF